MLPSFSSLFTFHVNFDAFFYLFRFPSRDFDFFFFLFFCRFHIQYSYHGYVAGVTWLRVIRDGIPQLVRTVSVTDWYDGALRTIRFK